MDFDFLTKQYLFSVGFREVEEQKWCRLIDASIETIIKSLTEPCFYYTKNIPGNRTYTKLFDISLENIKQKIWG